MALQLTNGRRAVTVLGYSKAPDAVIMQAAPGGAGASCAATSTHARLVQAVQKQCLAVPEDASAYSAGVQVHVAADTTLDALPPAARRVLAAAVAKGSTGLVLVATPDTTAAQLGGLLKEFCDVSVVPNSLVRFAAAPAAVSKVLPSAPTWAGAALAGVLNALQAAPVGLRLPSYDVRSIALSADNAVTAMYWPSAPNCVLTAFGTAKVSQGCPKASPPPPPPSGVKKKKKKKKPPPSPPRTTRPPPPPRTQSPPPAPPKRSPPPPVAATCAKTAFTFCKTQAQGTSSFSVSPSITCSGAARRSARVLTAASPYNQCTITIQRGAVPCSAPAKFPGACKRPLYALLMVLAPQCKDVIKTLNYNGTVSVHRLHAHANPMHAAADPMQA